jgi:hypothetical protein
MKKKTWLLILLLGAAVAGVVGYVMWNKAPAKVEDSKGTAVTATDLCMKFSSNEQEANQAFLNKALEVSGVVSEVIKNQDGASVVMLKGDDAGMSVQCTMREKDISVDAGKMITVKGFCSGNTMFDVLLTDCIIE